MADNLSADLSALFELEASVAAPAPAPVVQAAPTPAPHVQAALAVRDINLNQETKDFLEYREREGLGRIVYFGGEFFAYESAGGFYKPLDVKIIRSQVRKACAGWTLPLTPTQVNKVIDELESLSIEDTNEISPPAWLDRPDDLPDAGELIAVANGLLDTATLDVHPHTDNFLTFNSLDVPYIWESPDPERWLNFLWEVFYDDEEQINEFRKALGYLVSNQTHLQKMFFIVGKPSSGKSTLATIIEKLIGKSNVCFPSFDTIGGQFGLASLIGKKLAIIPDHEFTRRTDRRAVVRTIKTIVGNDAIAIERKGIGEWQGRLNTRLLVVANEMPAFNDESGALRRRFVVFETQDTFTGDQKDADLLPKLEAELPGILAWAIDGLTMLREDGDINTPSDVQATAAEAELIGTPVKAFVDDQCTLSFDAEISKDILYVRYKHWHKVQGLPGDPNSKQKFGRSLKNAFGQISDSRRRDNGHQFRYWRGITLTDFMPAPVAPDDMGNMTPLRHGAGNSPPYT